MSSAGLVAPTSKWKYSIIQMSSRSIGLAWEFGSMRAGAGKDCCPCLQLDLDQDFRVKIACSWYWYQHSFLLKIWLAQLCPSHSICNISNLGTLLCTDLSLRQLKEKKKNATEAIQGANYWKLQESQATAEGSIASGSAFYVLWCWNRQATSTYHINWLHATFQHSCDTELSPTLQSRSSHTRHGTKIIAESAQRVEVHGKGEILLLFPMEGLQEVLLCVDSSRRKLQNWQW